MPEREDRVAAPEGRALVERGWWSVFDVGREQGEDHFEITAVEGIAGSVKSALESLAPDGLGKSSEDPRDECSQPWRTDFNLVSEGTSMVRHPRMLPGRVREASMLGGTSVGTVVGRCR